jgi:hypothetical protein
VKDTREHLKHSLAERIMVLDGAWGAVRGGTLGSPASPLLLGCDNSAHASLPPGKARLRRCLESA